ncbi:MAG: 2TM domain-containing protein [Bacteroidetes bacterium]|nr:2TM domain-containing protein [Bacteroidota bacterium]
MCNFLQQLKVLIWIAFGCSILFFVFTTPEKNIESYLFTLLISLMYTLGYGLCNGLLNRFLNYRYSWIEDTKARVIATIISVVLLNIALTYLLNFTNFVLIQKVSIDDFFSEKYNFTNWFFINLALLVTTFLHAKEFMIAMKQNAIAQVTVQKTIATSANAQFESLKNQLDPHFLFNSLNVLDALIDENPQLAQEFTHGLSKVYRYVLEQKNKELVTIQQEIDFAKIYAELMKIRFEESIEITFEEKTDFEKLYIVPLSLQLILENAIKHNFATPTKPLMITIRQEGNYLAIENNLQQREKLDNREGIGISNIQQRFAMLTPEKILLEKDERKFKIKIPIITKNIVNMNDFSPNNNDNFAYEKAARRVKELKGFYGNLISYCVVIPVLVVVNILTSPKYHWFWWPMLGWGIGILSHALQVFGIGKNWEEKKIKELMEKDKK